MAIFELNQHVYLPPTHQKWEGLGIHFYCSGMMEECICRNPTAFEISPHGKGLAAIPYSGKFGGGGPIFAVFADNRLTAKIKPAK